MGVSTGRRCNMQGRGRCAFTLIELLVAVVIIALLIALLLPQLSRAREQSRRTKCATNLRSVVMAARMYATAWDNVFPGLSSPTAATGINSTFYTHISAADMPPGGGGMPANGFTWGTPNPISGMLLMVTGGIYYDSSAPDNIGVQGSFLSLKTLMGCPSRQFPNVVPYDASKGVFLEPRFWGRQDGGIVRGSRSRVAHYGYRYNGYINSLPPDSYTLTAAQEANLMSQRALLRNAGNRVNGQYSVVAFETYRYGLYPFDDFQATVPSGLSLAQAMIPNPSIWPHVSGGNVATADGAVQFVQNARYNGGNTNIGWPYHSVGDLTGVATAPEFSTSDDAGSIPAFLDMLASGVTSGTKLRRN